MYKRYIPLIGVATIALAVGGPTIADAKKSKHHRAKHVAHHAANTNASGDQAPGNGETPLTGTQLDQASAAALKAVPGGTVDRATTETDGPSGAAYEVHVSKSDGSHVLVIEDSSFNVLSTGADHGPPGGHRPGGPDGPGAPGGPGQGAPGQGSPQGAPGNGQNTNS